MTAVNRYQYDERIKNLEEERQDENSRNDAIVERMVTALQKQTPRLAIPTMVTKMYAKSHADDLAKAGTHAGSHSNMTPDQLKQLDDINSINKTSNAISLEGSPYAKYLGEIAGALGVVQQIASSKSKAKESADISDNITKSVYHLQNGGKFGDIKGALGAGTLKSLMGASATISAGSWLHDMATTGQISGLTSGTLAGANPGMMLSGLAGGIGGLGNTTGAVGAGALSGIGGLFSHVVNGHETSSIAAGLGKGASALSTLDPTVATLLGTMTMVGASIGANKMISNMMKNSPLSTNKRQNRWNMSHTTLKATDNPIAMSNYVQSNNILRQLSNQNMLSPGESQMLGKLNEIAFYTSTLHDIYESVANTGTHNRNHSTRALNNIDKDQINRDMNGKELQNLFKDGKISASALSFLKHNEGLKYLADVFNPGTYLRSFSGKDTAPGQFKIREALQQGDPLAAKKQMAQNYSITIADVDLLHADLKERIASADNSWEGRMLASGIYSNLLLQMIATKIVEQGSGDAKGKKGLIGALAKLQEEQEAKFQENQDMFIDGTLKPIMKWMSTVPGLSAAVPAIHAANYVLGTGAKAVGSLSRFVANPVKGAKDMLSGVKNMYNDVRDNVIDNMKPDEIKNEQSIRTAVGAQALSLQDQANMYIARYLPQDMQKIQWLLGSTERAKVQDRYSGEFMDPEELKKRYHDMANQIQDMSSQVKPEESYMDEFKSWGLKKIFKINDLDIQKSSHKNYSHLDNLYKELDASNISGQEQDTNLKFRSDPTQVGGKGTALNSTLSFLTNRIKNLSGQGNSVDLEAERRQFAYYDLMDKYIPLLQEIKDCTCKDCDCENSPEVPGGSKRSKLSLAFKRKRFELEPVGPNLDDSKKKMSINPLGALRILSGDSKNPLAPIHGKIASQSMQDEVKKSQQHELMEKFFSVYFKQLPYLEKIHKFITKGDGPKSGYVESKKDGVDPIGSMISGIGGFLGDALMDMFGFGDGKSKGKVAGKAGGLLARGGSGMLSRGLFQIAATLAKPGPLMIGAAIAGIAGAGIDFLFNDGKAMKSMWNSLKESSFGQTLSGLWDKAAEFMDATIDFFKNLPERIKNAILGKTEDVVNGTKSFFGISQIPKDQIIKDMDSKQTPAAKLSYLNSLGDKISGSDKKELQDKILEASDKNMENKWGFSMESTNGAQSFADSKFKSLDATKQAEFINDYNSSLSEMKLVNKMGSALEDRYKKINDQISNSFKENFQEKRSDQEIQDQGKVLQDALDKIKDMSINNTEAMNQIIQQNSALTLQSSKSLSDQINALSSNQAGITNMLNITAKTIQKPNVIELDKNVISVLPILKG